MGRRNSNKMIRCSHGRNRIIAEREAAMKRKQNKKEKQLSPEDKAWAAYMNEVRMNASGDAIAEVELERSPVYMGNAKPHVEPNYTKDRNYQHGPLPNVPKSQRLWT